MAKLLVLNRKQTFELGKYISIKTKSGKGYGGILKRLTIEGLVVDKNYIDFEDIETMDHELCEHFKVIEV